MDMEVLSCLFISSFLVSPPSIHNLRFHFSYIVSPCIHWSQDDNERLNSIRARLSRLTFESEITFILLAPAYLPWDQTCSVYNLRYTMEIKSKRLNPTRARSSRLTFESEIPSILLFSLRSNVSGLHFTLHNGDQEHCQAYLPAPVATSTINAS